MKLRNLLYIDKYHQKVTDNNFILEYKITNIKDI